MAGVESGKSAKKPSDAGPEKWKSQRRAAAHVYKANVICIKMCYENQFQLGIRARAPAIGSVPVGYNNIDPPYPTLPT